MPYFKWIGQDEHASLHSGLIVARCQQTAHQKLTEQNITVVSLVQEKKQKVLSFEQKASIVRHIGFLLQSGVHVPVAFQTVAATVRDPMVCAELIDCAQAVEQGFALDQACASYPRLFDTHFCTLVRAGSLTGSLVESLHMLADYYDFMASLYRSVRLSLFMPLVTLAFFVCVMVLFIAFVVPRFESVFQSIGQEPQGFARALFVLGSWARSWTPVYLLLFFGTGIFFLYRFLDNKIVRDWRDYMLFWMPGVRTLVRQASMVMFLQPCTLLLKGRVPLVDALEGAARGVSNRCAREHMLLWAQRVSAGEQWSDVLLDYRGVLPVSDLHAVLCIGEKTGTLAHVVSYVSLLYATQFKQRLRLLSRSIQPILLLLLGVCIAAFVLALYIPLLSLSDSVV